MPLLAVLCSLVGLGIFACSDDGSDGGGRGPNGGPDPEPIFRALEEDLIATCGGPNGTCHVRGSFQQAPTWLGGQDPYVTAKKYRGVIPATQEVGDSILLTQVRHAGPSLSDAPNDLFGRVSDWLNAEVPGPPLPNTGPFTVANGFNDVPLDLVASGLTGARLNFLATEANGTLTLSALKIKAPNNANITLSAPFFVVLPRNGKIKADPEVNGFAGELTVPAGASVDLFNGKMILLRWDPRGQLKVVFSTIATSPGQAVATGCTNLELFKSSALPAMKMTVEELADDGMEDGGDLPVIGTRPGCIGCHGQLSDTPGPAVRAMDLRGANPNANPLDEAAACAEAKQWIDTKDRSKSVILLNPTGRGNTLHPMKPISESDPIIAGIKAWVDAEQ